MLRVLIIVLGVLSICSARPSENLPEISSPNCPEGQAWVNGECNNRNNPLVAAVPLPSDIDGRNMITVPPNCPPGQQWINGQCRDVWNRRALAPSDIDAKNVITVPPNCPPGQQWINGQCRDVWRGGALALDFTNDEWRLYLRDTIKLMFWQIFNTKGVRAPKKLNSSVKRYLAQLNLWNKSIIDDEMQVDSADIVQSEQRNLDTVKIPFRIINIPNQCPIGYRHDALGICRRVL